MKTFRILSQNGNYYPQYRYWFWPYWFSFRELIFENSCHEPMLSRPKKFANESDATLFLVNQGVYEFITIQK